MNLVGGLIGGAIAGAIGAAIWAGISYGTGYEIGWIAWGVGGLVGLGVAAGWRGGGAPAGLLAVLLALASILAGRYAAVQLMVKKELGSEAQVMEQLRAELDDPEYLLSYVADDVVDEYHADGKAVNWPSGVDPEEAAERSDYPPDVWADAQARWNAMTSQERTEYRRELEDWLAANMEGALEEFQSYAAREGFFQSFDVIDIVFFLLAIVTAFKVAGSGQVGEAEV